MAHTIYGDRYAAERWAFRISPDVLIIPATFECEECEDVRQAIARWQERTEQQRDDSENEGQVHIVKIGWS